MIDRLDPVRRSENMRLVRSHDTGPEILVRKIAHRLGYRFRLHRRDLPGSPDLVFPKRNKIIFVHGCFWHRHQGCVRNTTPGTRIEFWKRKFAENEERDRRVSAQLRKLGWRVFVVWECETRNQRHPVAAMVHAFVRSRVRGSRRRPGSRGNARAAHRRRLRGRPHRQPEDNAQSNASAA
jgi:DNA mismatch endonuclease, patch repair protein